MAGTAFGEGDIPRLVQGFAAYLVQQKERYGRSALIAAEVGRAA